MDGRRKDVDLDVDLDVELDVDLALPLVLDPNQRTNLRPLQINVQIYVL